MNPFQQIDAAIQSCFDRAAGYLDAKGVVYPAFLREALVAELLGNLVFSVSILFGLSVTVGMLLLVASLLMTLLGFIRWKVYDRDARNWNPSLADKYAVLALARRDNQVIARLIAVSTFLLVGGVMVGWFRNGAPEALFTIFGALVLRSLTSACNLYAESTVPVPPPPPKTVPAMA